MQLNVIVRHPVVIKRTISEFAGEHTINVFIPVATVLIL
jgi:hypothetical protein